MSNQTNKIINADEKVLWSGQPNRFVFMVTNLYQPILILVGVFVAAHSYWHINFADIRSLPSNIVFIGILAVIIFSFRIVYQILSYSYIWYVITDKRIIFQTGLIGRDFDYVDYDKVENANVSVGFIDKLLRKNTGTIFIFSNRMETTYVRQGNGSVPVTTNVPFTLLSVVNPYDVFSKFKKVSFDIKTDENYPNALRPKNNPGYKTGYNPEE